MSKEETQKIYIELSDFLIRRGFYRKQFEKALEQELYDFCIILAWKTFIVFACEKIIDLLKRIYELDDNFAKKLKTLINDRHISAHVAEETLIATDILVWNNLNILLKIIKYIDNQHKNKFFSITVFDENNWNSISFSESDFKFIFNTKIIPKLKNAGTFNDATKIMQFIENQIDNLDMQSIEKLLSASFENADIRDCPHSYNQVIDANQGYIFFNSLLERTYKLNGDLDKWKEFYNQLGKRQGKYWNIKESLRKHGVDFGDYLIDGEWININDLFPEED